MGEIMANLLFLPVHIFQYTYKVNQNTIKIKYIVYLDKYNPNYVCIHAYYKRGTFPLNKQLPRFILKQLYKRQAEYCPSRGK